MPRTAPNGARTLAEGHTRVIVRHPAPVLSGVVVLLVAGGVVGVAHAAQPTAPAAPAAAPAPAVTPLSDERTLSRWAHAEGRAIVRRSPSDEARAVGRLRLDTEDGPPEVYLALERTVDAEGTPWIKVRLPARPNGQTGWVPRSALGGLHRNTSLLRVDRRTLRATLVRDGRTIWRARVGVGKRATPTPAGRFYVRERLVPASGTIYGSLAFGLSAYAQVSEWPGGGVVGIHGTDAPALIPGRPSHGCVRLRARDLRRLGRLLTIGTPVRIV
ncbi:L,D-transpeptidase [Patulibacter minatonensis]|uniref:L,D-transpeptidase n=1 Tax=Patulibacter minatonensis TaxID=298163 RepID=UPI0012F96B6B|nr:L,D-transpeptidase [Patulibacter minatonensis]